jgi:hypothetical protein
MIKYAIYLILMLCSIVALCSAQEQSGLTVEEMVFCTAIENREPIGSDTVFSDTIERIYCFTKISSDIDTTSISHIWYYNDQEVAKVDLAIKAKSWRTWSSKQIMEIWSGTWRVDVIAPSMEVIASKAFTVKQEKP